MGEQDKKGGREKNTRIIKLISHSLKIYDEIEKMRIFYAHNFIYYNNKLDTSCDRIFVNVISFPTMMASCLVDSSFFLVVVCCYKIS